MEAEEMKSHTEMKAAYGKAKKVAYVDVVKPFPNEHSARLRDPGDFDKDSFKRTSGGTIYGDVKVPTTIGIIWGKLKGAAGPDDFPIPQALRFTSKNWAALKAQKWLEDNNIKYITFERATNAKLEKSIGRLIHKSFTTSFDVNKVEDKSAED